MNIVKKKTIVHIDMTGPFNEDATYQENILPAINKGDGYDVFFIATCYEWKEGRLNLVSPIKKTMENGVVLIRLPFSFNKMEFLSRKIRKSIGLYKILCEISPDIIMMHCLQSYDSLIVIKYAKEHACKLIFDSHSDKNNSAVGIVAKILHKIYYRPIAKTIEKNTDKILSVSYECKDFLIKQYSINENKIEHYPLGGVVIDDEKYKEYRNNTRKKFGIPSNYNVYIHTGKMCNTKRTIDVLEAFCEANANNAILLVAGSVDVEILERFNALIKNKNIIYLDWVNSGDLIKYLCTSDVYLQPGSQSATFQNAACCRCLLLSSVNDNYKKQFVDSIIYVKTKEDIKKFFESYSENKQKYSLLQNKSFKIAKEELDYRKLALKIYQ